MYFYSRTLCSSSASRDTNKQRPRLLQAPPPLRAQRPDKHRPSSRTWFRLQPKRALAVAPDSCTWQIPSEIIFIIPFWLIEARECETSHRFDYDGIFLD